MNKKLSMLLIVILTIIIYPGVAYAAKDNPSFTLSTVEGKAGDIVRVSLGINNNPGITALQLKLGYSSKALELVSVKDNRLLGDALSFGKQDTNPYIISWYSSKSNDVNSNGTLAELEFRILDNATKNTITISYDADNVFNSSFKNIHFDNINGEVRIAQNENTPEPEATVLPPYINDDTYYFQTPQPEAVENRIMQPAPTPETEPAGVPSIEDSSSVLSIPETGTEQAVSPDVAATIMPTSVPYKTVRPTLTLVPAPASTRTPDEAAEYSEYINEDSEYIIVSPKRIRLESLTYRKKALQLKGKLSVKNATVKIKIGSRKYRKAKVKGRNFCLNITGRMRKNTKVIIKVSKKGYKQLIKEYRVE